MQALQEKNENRFTEIYTRIGGIEKAVTDNQCQTQTGFTRIEQMLVAMSSGTQMPAAAQPTATPSAGTPPAAEQGGGEAGAHSTSYGPALAPTAAAGKAAEPY